MTIKLDEDYRTFVNDQILKNIAIPTAVKGVVKELMRQIDTHECVCSCGKKPKRK